MRKFAYSFFLILAFTVLSVFAQAPFRIQGKCPPPNQTVYGSITVGSIGDIRHVPCPSRASVFTGNVDFSGATVTFGTLAANRFLGGNGTAALPTFGFTNSPTTGFFRAGADQIGISLAGTQRWSFTGVTLAASGVGNLSSVNDFTVNAGGAASYNSVGATAIGAGTDLTLDTTTGNIVATTTTGTIQLVGGASTLAVDGGANNISITAGNQLTAGGNSFVIDSATTGAINTTGDLSLRTGTTAGATFTAGSGVFIGDISGGGGGFLDIPAAGLAHLGGTTGTRIGLAASSLETESATDTLYSSLSIWDLSDAASVTTFKLRRTITAGGTTGNQVINLPAGTVNFAAAATALTVTNSTVTANSIIITTTRTNDATCTVKNVVAGAGTFTINMTAGCTAETSVGFLVTN